MTPLSSLCQGRWEPLKPFFTNLYKRDLVNISFGVILSGVPSTLRGLLQCFWVEVLQREIEELNANWTLVERSDDGAGIQVNHLVGKTSPPWSVFIKLDEVITLIESKMTQDEREKVVNLDLSDNLLFDGDVAKVRKLVDLLPNLTSLNLSANRFYGVVMAVRAEVDDFIKYLAGLPNMKYVDITRNPISSKLRNDFIKGLNKDHLSKVIWISESQLENHLWETYFADPDSIKMVREVHMGYYAKGWKNGRLIAAALLATSVVSALAAVHLSQKDDPESKKQAKNLAAGALIAAYLGAVVISAVSNH